ncbi:MAG TPA: VOC family protein [Nocardioides sp.]|nr:VOC family protein [Nocardioides sp.]
MAPTRHHSFDYVELAAPDLAAAKAFYGEAFGWSFTDYGPDYTGIRRPGGEGEMGGLNPVRPAGPGLPLVILYSDDLDATYAAVQAAGGTIDEEPFEFPGGRRFHFSDAAGNTLAVWQQS